MGEGPGNLYAVQKVQDLQLFRRVGHKAKQGDGKSPEGFYTVYPRQMNPNSRYWLSFIIGNPNPYDRSMRYTGSAIMLDGR